MTIQLHARILDHQTRMFKSRMTFSPELVATIGPITWGGGLEHGNVELFNVVFQRI